MSVPKLMYVSLCVVFALFLTSGVANADLIMNVTLPRFDVHQFPKQS